MSSNQGQAHCSCDAIVIGAGFAGLYMLHRLLTLGMSVQVFESAGDVGGTWYWNRYPGARCDAQSLVYAYTFDEAVAEEWRWSERYAAQPEILKYLKFIAERLDLRRHIQFDTPIASARFDDATDIWTVTSSAGKVASARYLLMATGALSAGRMPDITGISTFRGASYHTGDWPHAGVDFKGKRVAVLGTGSSGVQAIPLIAAEAEHLTVFQRTPAYTTPARNTPLLDEEVRKYEVGRTEFRKRLKRGEIVGISDVMLADHLPPTLPSTLALTAEEREKVFEDRWQVGGALIARSFRDSLIDESANQIMADFFHRKIREIVKDPVTAETLTPKDYPIGTKRLCVGTDYYETFNRSNVELVDLTKTPIETITPTGVRTTGKKYAVDIIVFATGFDAMTGALLRIDIRGTSGRSLREEWAAGPVNYLGVGVAGFPNLLTITGPGSPSVLGNVVMSIEQHVEWMAELIDYARSNGIRRIDIDPAAQAAWTQHVTDMARATLMVKGKSWYLGANVPGKPRVFMPYIGGIAVYRDRCDQIAREGYPGFVFVGATSPARTEERMTAVRA